MMSSPASRHRWLEDLLQTYEAADSADRDHRSASLALLLRAPDPFDQAYYTPGHFTASAFVMSPDSRELLLILHSKLRRWLQPGGHVEPDDSDLVATARREVQEETGLTGLELVFPGLFDIDVHDIPAHGAAVPAHRHFDVRFLFRARERTLMHTGAVRDVRWVVFSEIRAVAPDLSVMRAVDKIACHLQ